MFTNSYPIVVSGRNGLTNKQKRKLRRMGLRWDGLSCSGVISTQWRANKIKRYCEDEHLKFKLSNSLGNRNSDCRRIFFKNVKPQVLGKYYICAYCGKLRTKDNITVDHIYPVKKSADSIKYQNKMRRRGIDNINDPKNLIAACRKCNLKKSSSTGVWIIKAKLGRYKYLWYLRWAIKTVIFGAVIACIIYFVMHKPELMDYLAGFLAKAKELMKELLEN